METFTRHTVPIKMVNSSQVSLNNPQIILKDPLFTKKISPSLSECFSRKLETVSSLLFSNISETAGTVALDSCSWMTGVAVGVVLCCCNASTSRFPSCTYRDAFLHASVLPHFDSWFELKQVDLTMSTCLNVLIPCHWQAWYLHYLMQMSNHALHSCTGVLNNRGQWLQITTKHSCLHSV